MREHGLRDFRAAKEKAGVRLGLEDRGALPTNQEIERAIAERNRVFHGDVHDEVVEALRRAALELMRALGGFDPRLVGPVLSGNADEHSAIDLHLFSDEPEAVGAALAALGISARAVEHRLRTRRDAWDLFPGYRFRYGGLEFCALVFRERGRGNAPLSPVDGRPMRRATDRDVEALLGSGAAQRLPTST